MIPESQITEMLLACRTVAVVGATDGGKPGRASFEIPQMLQRRGVRIIPINPTLETALGERCLKSVADLAEPVDILDVFRRPEAIPELADALLAMPKALRPGLVWLQTGITHAEAEARLEAAGFKVVSDMCLGVLMARVR